jgi:short-chain Z-isoprenyl diphosphate synthase
MTIRPSGTEGSDRGSGDQRDPRYVRMILGCYPPRWRERYGEEFAALLTDLVAGSSRAARMRLLADAIGGGVAARRRLREGTTIRGQVRESLTRTIRAAIALLAERFIYPVYTSRLRGQLAGGTLPRHVGIIMDGNRRWARQQGLASPSLGHKYGAEHAEEVLGWCERAGIGHVTVFMCSAENLAHRDSGEVAFLMRVIEELVAGRLTRDLAWQVHVAGNLDMLPDSTARALKQAAEASRDCTTGRHVTLAVGYGGRQEVIEAFRSLLYEHAERGTTLLELADSITADDIARHLYTAGQPDPDLVIRTSGEQRLSNFLLWQSAYSELYFCEAYWPAFREIDFLRALRSFAARHRRYGR